MDKRELLIKLCHDIFEASINSEESNALLDVLIRYVKNGALPFVTNAIDVNVYDDTNYDLGAIYLGEYTIYDSLKTGRDGDVIRMTRFIRLTKGVGENERELDIEL